MRLPSTSLIMGLVRTSEFRLIAAIEESYVRRSIGLLIELVVRSSLA